MNIHDIIRTVDPDYDPHRYARFLESKRQLPNNFGIEPNFMPSEMFDFQKFAAEHAIRKGRCALFLDTGLGKTLIELTIAANYVRHTNKPALIITPLAVAFQFLKEAERFGIDDVEHTLNGKFTGKIILCNYERLHLLNPGDFDCVICDESSILKNYEGAIKTEITAFMRKKPYRFLATATPSPNDFEELGTSSEALGDMGYIDMLTKYFTNKQKSISPNGIGVKWRLKGHAENPFFEWVSSWSISARKPSDLGFNDERYILPELITNNHLLENDAPLCVGGQFRMFAQVATSLSEVKAEERATVKMRCEHAAELASVHDFSVYWCNLNPESETLAQIDREAVEIRGSMKLEKKEEILLAFSKGEIKRLITKPKITAFGLNWQHCAHTVFFPSFSFEQYYQAIRRFWRFGQTRPVTVDRILSEGQIRTIQAIDEKAQKANDLFSKLNFRLNNVKYTRQSFEQPVSLPSFLNA